jgi:hypothetical protein
MPVSKRTNWKGLDFLSLDTTLTIFLQNDPWFKQHPVALEILKSGNSLISINKSNLHNLQALLGNMCSYGATRWQYEPGQATSADRVLSNLSRVTDCKSLADIFVELVQHLPLTISNLQARHMTSSMHHDLNAGRRLELPWLRGGVARMAQDLGIAAPRNRVVSDILALYTEGKP